MTEIHLTLIYRRSDGFPYPLDEVDRLEEDSLVKYEAYLAKKNTTGGCTLETAARRQEWYASHSHDAKSTNKSRRHDMTIPQREEYIRAVRCLQSLPPRADQKKYPGVMNRYDDFVLTHETQAFHLHSTVLIPHARKQRILITQAAPPFPRAPCVYLGLRKSSP